MIMRKNKVMNTKEVNKLMAKGGMFAVFELEPVAPGKEYCNGCVRQFPISELHKPDYLCHSCHKKLKR